MAELGRPLTYNAKLHPKLVKALARQELTDEAIAEQLEIDRATLYEWYKKYPELADAKKYGAQTPNQMVVDSLFRRAVGGFEKKTITEERNAKGELIKVITKIETVPGDPVAQIWWTKNREPDEWRDTRPSDPPAMNTSPLKIEFPKFTDEQMAALLDPSKQSNLEISEGKNDGPS